MLTRSSQLPAANFRACNRLGAAITHIDSGGWTPRYDLVIVVGVVHLITHRCGHEAAHDINGHYAADCCRLAERLEHQDCLSCRTAIKQARVAAYAQQVGALELIMCQLSGSIKQIQWAETIRVTRLAKLCRSNRFGLNRLAEVPDAKWWIDHRSVDDKTLMSAGNEHPSFRQSHCD